jgi:DNA-binding NtrC family response regulator/predicted hydrocarbon binding protein
MEQGSRWARAKVLDGNAAAGGRPSAVDVGGAAGASVRGDPIHRRLAFNQAEASIRFDGFRMMLVYSTLLARLKQELINHCGYARARGVVERLGYAEGTKTVLLAGERGQSTDFETVMAVAGEVWTLTGNARMSVVSSDIRRDLGRFRVELELQQSIEAHAHIEAFGTSSEPMCWLQTGATSGLCSAFAGRAVVFREIECVAMGHARCLLLGQPVEAWGETAADAVEETGFHLRPDTLVNRFSILKAQRAGVDGEELADVVGVSASFVAALDQLRKVAPTRATVLLQGETGTGKEVFANLLHRMSRRATAPFVAINCAALPDSLAEAELFGVERGAYTGATQARLGRFERASTGTLFLDEVGTLSPAVQAKLLRVLQVGQVEPLGGGARQVDVRVVAATNDDLWQKVMAGEFREDLYFRLATFPITIPPLRERRDDIPLLIEHFLHHFRELHERASSGLSGRAVQALLHYDYPGNVRELEHIIERAVIRANDGELIDMEHLGLPLGLPAHSRLLQLDTAGRLHDGQTPAPPGCDQIDWLLERGMSLDGVEQALLSGALDKASGNRSQAARALGLTRRQFNYRFSKSSLAGR